MRLLLTRPETESDALKEALVAASHDVLQEPLLTIEILAPLPSLADAQALIATSRNGLQALASAPIAAEVLRLPLLAVGPATAALARSLGFTTVLEGPSGAAELVNVIRERVDPAGGPLVHLAGDTLAFDLKGALETLGFTVRQETVYRSRPAEKLGRKVADALRMGHLDGVILMSPRTAKIYARLVSQGGLSGAVASVTHYCLSEAVVRELGLLGTVRHKVARSPNSQEMLALVACEARKSS
jgi:uroporphyrinogen-III synthase